MLPTFFLVNRVIDDGTSRLSTSDILIKLLTYYRSTGD